jgi:glycosyltransferase involved in cell wall biosynthesis
MLSLSHDSGARVLALQSRDVEHVLPAIRQAPGRPAEPTVSVIVPTLNEASNIAFVFSTLSELDLDLEVILVDGRSKDDTVRVARCLRPSVIVVEERRKGKGAALQAGFAAAHGDIIVMLDSDGSADGREIPMFVEALKAGADFAKGSRFAVGGGSADITRSRRTGNGMLNQLVNKVFGARFTDLCYGYNAFWRDCLPYLRVDCDGFEVETLLLIRAVKSGLRITEVPSYESIRIHGTSNLNATKDGLRVLRTILSEVRRAKYLTTVHAPRRANVHAPCPVRAVAP